VKQTYLAILSLLLIAVVAVAGEVVPAIEVTPKPRVLEINKRDSIASARFRVNATELRDILFRVLDEDGFRVTRLIDPIPPEGKTFKGKKRLRHVEWEIIPGDEEGTSVLSIEYSRFGNRSWAEKALGMVVDEIGKHDPPPGSIAKPAETDSTPDTAAPIKGPNNLDHVLEGGEKEPKKDDLVFPINPLEISSAKPKTAETSTQKTPGEKAEILQEPNEEVFRGVQRGDLSESDGAERIGAFLEIFWADAGHPPEAALRKTFSTELAHGLAQRQLASREAATLVEMVDRGVRAEHVDAETSQHLMDELKAKLKATDLDDEPRTEITKTISSILGQ